MVTQLMRWTSMMSKLTDEVDHHDVTAEEVDLHDVTAEGTVSRAFL